MLVFTLQVGFHKFRFDLLMLSAQDKNELDHSHMIHIVNSMHRGISEQICNFFQKKQNGTLQVLERKYPCVFLGRSVI